MYCVSTAVNRVQKCSARGVGKRLLIQHEVKLSVKLACQRVQFIPYWKCLNFVAVFVMNSITTLGLTSNKY